MAAALNLRLLLLAVMYAVAECAIAPAFNYIRCDPTSNTCLFRGGKEPCSGGKFACSEDPKFQRCLKLKSNPDGLLGNFCGLHLEGKGTHLDQFTTPDGHSLAEDKKLRENILAYWDQVLKDAIKNLEEIQKTKPDLVSQVAGSQKGVQKSLYTRWTAQVSNAKQTIVNVKENAGEHFEGMYDKMDESEMEAFTSLFTLAYKHSGEMKSSRATRVLQQSRKASELDQGVGDDAAAPNKKVRQEQPEVKTDPDALEDPALLLWKDG